MMKMGKIKFGGGSFAEPYYIRESGKEEPFFFMRYSAVEEKWMFYNPSQNPAYVDIPKEMTIHEVVLMIEDAVSTAKLAAKVVKQEKEQEKEE